MTTAVISHTPMIDSEPYRELSDDATELILFCETDAATYARADAIRTQLQEARSTIATARFDTWAISRWQGYFIRARGAYRAECGSSTGFHFPAAIIVECAAWMHATEQQEGAY